MPYEDSKGDVHDYQKDFAKTGQVKDSHVKRDFFDKISSSCNIGDEMPPPPNAYVQSER